MKEVVNDSQIPHLWANQLQEEARNSRNTFYFYKDTIYSYGSHFPIARHVKNEQGEEAVLFTERTYSSTTSGHVSIVSSACNHLKKVYCYNPNSTHAENFERWRLKAEQIATNLVKAKKPEIYLNQIAGVAGNAKDYAGFFSVPIPETLAAALSVSNKEEYLKYASVKLELAKKEELKRKKEQAARNRKALNKWLKGGANRMYGYNGLDHLRIKEDKIETTQGIELTIPYGIQVYEKLKAGKLEVGDKVLQYSVRKINGVVSIGCHTFKKEYLLKFGSQLMAMVK